MTDNNSQQELADLTCLYEITRALASSTDLRDCLEQVMETLSARTGMTNGTVTIINPVNGELAIEVAHGMSDESRKLGKYKIGEGITGRVVASGAPIVVPQISEEPMFLNRTKSRGNVKAEATSFICVPIKRGNNTIGALSIDRKYREGLNFEKDLQFLTVISGLIAQSVTRIQAVNREKKRLEDENQLLKMELYGKYQFENFISNSSRMQEVFEMMHRVKDSEATVFLRGESGTGKTLVAKGLHYNSKRAKEPFVVVNCSAVPETLLESELFGHEKGAFTGAHTAKKGRFELAGKGTLFLDEIGELSQAIQVKLLNVVQDREFQPLGSGKTIKSGARLITATNKNLEDAVASGSFREDLYYRLNVFPIYMPPLRDRKTDILLLAEFFLNKYSAENNRQIRRISTPAIDLLMQYHWPGNVRELENCIERAVLICDDDSIKSIHLPPSLQTARTSGSEENTGLSFSRAVENFEKELIVASLKRTGGNQTKTAEELGSSLRIINYKIGKYLIDCRQFKKANR
ncbi:MAG: sigma 54-interacting transcriptional regulator [Proteobacteria bacterium]|nr:sigma 54-interacting transcriptional regulator [Pseudomonadota bacterium]MBU1737152.1 sigma 54-interacting transcriptional regulator [Pseudomonadota bacterium]